MVGLGIADSILGNLHRILIPFFGIYRHIYLLAKHLKLLDSRRTVYVAGHKKRAARLLAFELFGKFAAHGGLSGALQTRHEYHGRISRKIDLGSVAAHQGGKLVMYNLYHQLARLNGVEHILAKSLCLDSIGKLLGDFIVDVGVKKRAAHILERFGYVDFGNLTLAFE